MKQTNLELIRKRAIEFLYIEPEINKELPIFVLHPFFDNRNFFIPGNKLKEGIFIDIFESDENLSIARDLLKSRINSAKNPFQVIYMIRDADKRTFFKFIMDYLDDKDFGEIFRYVWTATEYPHFDINVSVAEFKKMFKKANKNYLMEKEEIKELETMPEEIIIYRGITSDTYYKALSWTLDENRARWFSKRFNKNGNVFQAKIKKKDVLAYFNNEEKEIIIDYNKIYDLTEC